MSEILVNITTPPTVSPNTSLGTSGIADKATRALFLSLFIVGGFVGNSVLIATIAQSSRLKKSSINLCILSLAVANILDSVANMPLILGATITETWDYGIVVCRLNAFGLHLISIVVILGLTVLTLDRCLAVKDPHKHHSKASRRKVSVVIGLSWVHALAFSIPVLLNSVVPIKVFPVRYLCTISANTPLVYLCLTSIFAYLIPIVMCLGFFIYITQRAVKQKRHDKKQRSREGYVEGSLPSSSLWAEMEGAKYAGVLFSLWCVLQGPYFVLSSIMWYKNSTELSGVKAVTDFLHFEYPWELELALTWIKLSYPVFLPSVTFLWKKEVWQKFKNTVLCKKSNLVLDASPRSSPEHTPGANGNLAASNGVPVLFATENGLHFQTYEDEEDGFDDSDPGTDLRDNSNTQVVTTKKCDVYGSQDFLQIDEDTSDYDSSGEIDPFSTSNPISVRTEYGRQKSQSFSTNSKASVYQTSPLPVTNAENEGMAEKTEVNSAKTEVLDEVKAFAPGKEAKRNVRHKNSNSTSSLRDKVAGDVNEAFVTEEPLNDVDAGPEPNAEPMSAERTSHDSGMGSLEKYKKITRKLKVKKQAVQQTENVTTDKKTEPDRPPAEIVNANENRTVSSAPKKKRKPRTPPQSQSESTDVVEKPKENPKDTESPRQASDTLPMKTVVKPKPPPRKSKEITKDQAVTNENVKELTPRDKSAAQDKPDRSAPSKPNMEPEGKPKPAERKSKFKSKESTQDYRSSHKETSFVESQDASTTTTGKEKVQSKTSDEQNEVPTEKPKKRKKKKKVLDPEQRRKKMFAELDEGVQGVLY